MINSGAIQQMAKPIIERSIEQKCQNAIASDQVARAISIQCQPTPREAAASVEWDS